MPKYNDKGKYVVRMYYQDDWRAIVIDDRVLTSPNMHIHVSLNDLIPLSNQIGASGCQWYMLVSNE
jgi:hypothetical protein